MRVYLSYAQSGRMTEGCQLQLSIKLVVRSLSIVRERSLVAMESDMLSQYE